MNIIQKLCSTFSPPPPLATTESMCSVYSVKCALVQVQVNSCSRWKLRKILVRQVSKLQADYVWLDNSRKFRISLEILQYFGL